MQGNYNSGFPDEMSDERGLPPPYYNNAPPYGPQQEYTPCEPTIVDIGLQQPLICQPDTNELEMNADSGVKPPQLNYNDYFCWSIFNIIFCSLPIGAIALKYSYKTRSNIALCDDQAAAKTSCVTCLMNVMALLVGIPLNIIIVTSVFNHGT